MRVLKNIQSKGVPRPSTRAALLQAAAQAAHPPWMHRALVGAFIVEMDANGHRPVDLTAHEAPLEPAPKPACLEHAGQLRQRVEALASAAAQAIGLPE